MNIKEDEVYTIEYIDRDYFNAQEITVLAKGKAVLNNEDFIFVVTDSYGMDKFVKEVRVIL